MLLVDDILMALALSLTGSGSVSVTVITVDERSRVKCLVVLRVFIVELSADIVVVLANLAIRGRNCFGFCWSANCRSVCCGRMKRILAGLLIALGTLGTLARFAFVVCFGACGGLMLPET